MADEKKYKILLAEDDKYISRAFTDGLSRAGFLVINAFDGDEALKKIKSESPDLVLLDIIMPVMNGFEVLEELNRDESLKMINGKSYKKTPIIAFTNLEEEQDKERAKSLGVSEYLVKANYSMREVIKIIKKQLSA